MKLTKFLAVILTAIICAGVVRSQDSPTLPPPPLIFAPPTDAELQKFSSPAAGFDAVFAGEPKKATKSAEGIFTESYTAKNNGMTTVVSVYKLSDSDQILPGREDVFQRVKEELVRPEGNRLIAENSISVDGFAARDFSVADKIGFTKTRVIPIVDRIYEITIHVTNWSLLGEARQKNFEAEVARFNSSFKIISPFDHSLIAGETTLEATERRRGVAKIASFIGEPDDDDWREYRFDQLGGAVSFPSEPRMETSQFEASLVNSTMTSYTAAGDSQGYIFAAVNLGFAGLSSDFRNDMYDGWQSGLAEGIPGGKLEYSDIEFDGKPARKVSVQSSTLWVEAVGVMIDGRLYQLMVVVAKTGLEPQATNRDKRLTAKFFDSFRAFPVSLEAADGEAVTQNFRVIGNEEFENEEFGFTVKLPFGWNEVGETGARESVERWKKNDGSITRRGKDSLTQSTSRTTVIFHATKAPTSAFRKASFIAAAESVQVDNLDMKTIAEASEENFIKNLGFQSLSRLKVVNINGTIFYKISLRKTLPGIELKQILYMRKLKGKILQFVISYIDEADLETIENSFKTLKFSPVIK